MARNQLQSQFRTALGIWHGSELHPNKKHSKAHQQLSPAGPN